MGKDIKGTPKISVIIPVYNTAGYVADAIRTITAQTLREIELIVINDGSTDNGLEVVQQLAAEDSRIKVYSQTNHGLSVTRNRGIEKSTGEYVYFMDSDDLLEEDALQLCYEKCQAEKLDFVIFDADSFCEIPGFQFPFSYLRSGRIPDKVYTGMELLRALLDTDGYKSSACLSFVNREYLNRIKLRFYPGILHEDELYTPQLYIPAERAGRIDRAFFHRRYRSDSIMTSVYSKRTITGYLTVLEQLDLYSKGKAPETRRMVRFLMKRMLNAVMGNAYTMPREDRRGLLRTALSKYGTMVAPGSALGLLLPKLKESRRKK